MGTQKHTIPEYAREYIAAYILTSGTQPTREHVIDLQSFWFADDCRDEWAIEDAPGFEAYRDELREYRMAVEAQREAALKERAQQQHKRLTAKAEELGISGNLALAAYVIALEERLTAMEHDIYRLQGV